MAHKGGVLFLYYAWKRLKSVDKRTIEGRIAKTMWQKVWFDVAKIALACTFIATVVVSLSGMMPPELHDLAAMISVLYSGRTASSVVFSGGLGVVSTVTVALNIHWLSKNLDLLDYSLRIAETRALKKTVRKERGW